MNTANTVPKNIPYRLRDSSEKPILVAEWDKPAKQPVLIKEARVGVFDLSNKEQSLEYQAIFNHRSQGRSLVEIDRVEWDTQGHKYVAFVRWYDMYLENPKQKDREVVYG